MVCASGGRVRSIVLFFALCVPSSMAWAVPPVADDTDGDGIPDDDDASPHDCDGDHDGIPDPVERGLSEPIGGSAGGDCFVADADPTTTTSPTEDDTDGGGLV